MFCPKCGVHLADGASFCPECKTRVADSAVSRKMAGNYSARLRSEARGKHASAGRVGKSVSATRSADSDRRKFIAIVLAVALVLAVAFLLWDTHLRPYGINSKDFPSDGVRSAVAALDDDGDNQITREQAASITELTVDGGEDVSGLAIFPNLEKLTIANNETRSVDVTQAASLEEIDASGASSLASISFGANEKLSSVDLSGTAVSSVDLSDEPALLSACFKDSELASLNIAGSVALEELDVSGTGVASVDLSGLASLASLRCEDDVSVENLSDTPLSAYWLVADFENDISPYGEAAGENIHVKAEYDDDNRLLFLSYTDAAASSRVTDISYAYDEEGRVATVKFSGMNAESSAPSSNEWKLTYDEDGRIATAVAASGVSFAYEYDNRGLLVSCTQTSGGSSASATTYSFSYNEDGALAGESHGKFSTEYSYDAKGRLTSAKTVYEGVSESEDDEDADSSDDDEKSRVDAATFAYDAAGNCIRYNVSQQIGAEGTLDEKYFYDSDGRLIDASRKSEGSNDNWYQENRGYDSAGFEYDENGNLTGATFERSNADESADDSFRVSYHRVFATDDDAPVCGTWDEGYPFAASVNRGSYLAGLVASGSSVFTPWGNAPSFTDLVFNRSKAIFGTSAR